MTPEQIQKMAEGFPPSSIGKDHEEVVAWLAKNHVALQEQLQKLEEQLAELASQEPVACKKRLVNHRSGVAYNWTYHGDMCSPSHGDIFRIEVVPLFTRAAPPAPLTVKRPDDGLDDCIRDWPEQWRNDFDCGYNYATWRFMQEIEKAGGSVSDE